MDAVWKDAYVTDTSLTEAMSQLRQVLGDDAQQPTYVQTVHRRGYRFVAPLTLDGGASVPLRLAEKAAPPEVAADEPSLPGAVSRDRIRRSAPALALAALAVAAAIGLVSAWRLARPAPAPVTRATLPIALGDANAMRFSPALALTPDGTALVHAVNRAGRSQLFVRALDRFDSVPLAGTEGAVQPFVSPDGRSVGFFADGKLKRIPLGGGPVVTLSDAPFPAGGSWGDDGTIVFTRGEKGGLFRVAASGGSPEALTVPDARSGEIAHMWPEVLPGSAAVLFTVWPAGGLEDARVAVVALRGKPGPPRVLVSGGSFARYAPTGHIVFARKSLAMAVAFDPGRAETRGEPVALLDGVAVDWFTGAAQLAFSRTGTLTYVPGTHEVPAHSLVRLDREGNARPLAAATRPFMNLDPAPNARSLA